MQLLLYAYSCLLIIVISSIVEIIQRIRMLIYVHDLPMMYIVASVIMLIAYSMCVMLICTLTNFIKFHLKLVLENYTTIENLEREEGARSKFDIGRGRNWEQVFGSNPRLWWLPAHVPASRPVGDGVRWRVHYTRVIDEDEEGT